MRRPTWGAFLPLYLAAALAVYVDRAQAETTVGVHLYTYHIEPRMGYNNVNPGLYVVQDGKTAGVYLNSERRLSTYVGWTLQHGGWGLTLGAVAGYRAAHVLPLVVPSYRIGNVRVSALLPPGKENWGVHISTEF